MNDLIGPCSDFLNKIITVKVDRPMGSRHPRHGFIYPVNYGYIPETISGDGEELDAYILGIYEPLETFTGKCIAIIHRTNDNDDKLIVVPENLTFTNNEIRVLTDFQERFFDSEIIRDKLSIITTEKNYNMNIKIEYMITEDEFLEMLESIGWKTYSSEQIKKALDNTMYMVKATVNGQLAGIGRVVGDYSIVCMLTDICVKPEFQNKGIGLKIVNELKRLIESNVNKGEKMQIELTPTAGNEKFYERAGFKYNPEKITGMYLWIKK